MLKRELTRREIGIDVVAFIGTVVWAALGRWEARDLVWALWIASLIVGYATIVTSIVRGVRGKWRELGPLAVAGGVGMLAFFTFHFGMFHFVHGVFLNAFFPLVEDGSALGSIVRFAVPALASYWPFVVLTLVSRVDDVRRKGTRGGEIELAAPYKNVVRMHLLIFVFAGLHAAGLSRLAIYPIMAAYFFPWRAFTVSRSRGESSAATRRLLGLGRRLSGTSPVAAARSRDNGPVHQPDGPSGH